MQGSRLPRRHQHSGGAALAAMAGFGEMGRRVLCDLLNAMQYFSFELGR